jgi:hypothetical protein
LRYPFLLETLDQGSGFKGTLPRLLLYATFNPSIKASGKARLIAGAEEEEFKGDVTDACVIDRGNGEYQVKCACALERLIALVSNLAQQNVPVLILPCRSFLRFNLKAHGLALSILTSCLTARG